MVKFSHLYTRASKAFVTGTTKGMLSYLNIGVPAILATNLDTIHNSYEDKVVLIAT